MAFNLSAPLLNTSTSAIAFSYMQLVVYFTHLHEQQLGLGRGNHKYKNPQLWRERGEWRVSA